MPVIQNTASIAANTTNSNLVTGSIYERPNFNAVCRYAFTASATGLLVTINHGSRTIMEEGAISLQNRMPLFPDDFLTQAGIRALEQLVIKVRNTTGGALTIFYNIQLLPR